MTGHLAGLLRGRSELARTYSDFVYVFHIPALVLLAGSGARRAKADAAGLTKIFWQTARALRHIRLQGELPAGGRQPSWSFVWQTFGLWSWSR